VTPADAPPPGLLVAEAIRVQVAATKVREGDGAVVDQLAAVLTLRGHVNGTTEPITVTAALTTSGAAMLAGSLLEALDLMRETPGAAPT